MNSTTAARSCRGLFAPRYPAAPAESSSTAGRRRLPPEATMYCATSRTSGTSDSRRLPIISSTLRRSSATGANMDTKLMISVIIPALSGVQGSAMYAVIKSGGKQYRVASGEKVRVELLSADVGASVSFDEVVLVGAGDSVKVGTPL